MTAQLAYILALFAIPLVALAFAGYGKLKVKAFLGVSLFLGALSLLLSYLTVDLTAALWQLGALAVGSLLFVVSIGFFGERFSYRSPMALLAAVGLFPWGVLIFPEGYTALIVYGSLLAVNILFAFLLSNARKNSIQRRSTKAEASKPADRFIMVVPAMLTVVAMALTFFAQLVSFI